MRLSCRFGWHKWTGWEKHGEPQAFQKFVYDEREMDGTRKKLPNGQGRVYVQRTHCFWCGREKFAKSEVAL